MVTGGRKNQRDPAPPTLQCLTEIDDSSGYLLCICLVALRAHHPVCHEIQSNGKWPEFPIHDIGTGTHIAIGQTRLNLFEMCYTRFEGGIARCYALSDSFQF